LTPRGRPFWIATEDYVGNCSNVALAQDVYARSRALGFRPYATDASAGQQAICWWSF
jgi:cysteinyl-tRNA synthetase